MKNSTIFLALIIVGLLVAGFFYFNSNQITDQRLDSDANQVIPPDSTSSPTVFVNEQAAATDQALAKPTPTSSPSATTAPSSTSGYFTDSEKSLPSTSPKTVLFFYANWCPTCKKADLDIQAKSSSISTDLSIVRINYNDTDTSDAEKDLAEKYQITYQHTLVYLDENGAEITRWNGGELDKILEKTK